MSTVLINIQDVIESAAGSYLSQNAQMFKGTSGDKGDKGDKGDTKYVWIRYANNDSGAGINVNPIGKSYIGIAVNKSTPVASNNPADYVWALYKGADGDKGDKGDKGIKGDRGVSVHHLKMTSTTDLLGFQAVAGETDTYTFYGDANETIVLGWFSVTNGVPGEYKFDDYWRDKSLRIGESDTVLTTTNQTLLEAVNELDQDKLETAGGTISGDLVVSGDFTVSGTTTTVDTETVLVKDNLLVINNGEVGAGVTKGVAGIEVDRGLATDYQFLFDEVDHSFKIGEIGQLQKVATREDTPLDTGVATWDAAENRFVTTGTPTFASVQLSGGTGTQGLMSWNNDEETVDLVMDGAVLQIGQEFLVNVRNSTGTTITDGTPVMFTGTLGNSGRILVAPMDTTDTANAMYFVGLATVDIPAGEDGKATMFGKIRGVNTTGAAVGEVWADGDVLYLSPTVVGGLTKVEPTAGQVDMPVAAVVKAHGNGTMYVRAVAMDRNAVSPGVQAYVSSRLDVIEW